MIYIYFCNLKIACRSVIFKGFENLCVRPTFTFGPLSRVYFDGNIVVLLLTFWIRNLYLTKSVKYFSHHWQERHPFPFCASVDQSVVTFYLEPLTSVASWQYTPPTLAGNKVNGNQTLAVLRPGTLAHNLNMSKTVTVGLLIWIIDKQTKHTNKN